MAANITIAIKKIIEWLLPIILKKSHLLKSHIHTHTHLHCIGSITPSQHGLIWKQNENLT